MALVTGSTFEAEDKDKLRNNCHEVPGPSPGHWVWSEFFVTPV